MSRTASPPSDWKGTLKQSGPGLIISANIVGSGELIVTTKLGAEVGFALLWFIILGCMIKVFLQVELGRRTIVKGVSTLEVLNAVPGPKLWVSWLVWCWLLMFAATIFQLSGMVVSIAEVFQVGGAALSKGVWALLITASCAGLLFIGRYRFIEKFSTGMVAGFTLFTIAAVFSLYWTKYGITGGDLAKGLRFRLPEDFSTAFGAFGVVGVGASELIYYPYWCLEKGYARHVGPDDGTAAWRKRAAGWVRVLQWDAWLSMVIYTGATVAFYLLGAAVLNRTGQSVEDEEMIATLSNLYQASFGSLGLVVFLIGAFVVLYSTLFISTASNARLSADLLRVGKLVPADAEAQKQHWIKIACVALPAIYFLLHFVAVGKPVTLILIGAVAQALMLPPLCFAVLWFRYADADVVEPPDAAASALKPGRVWMLCLWAACLLMASAGIYQLAGKMGGLYKNAAEFLQGTPPPAP